MHKLQPNRIAGPVVHCSVPRSKHVKCPGLQGMNEPCLALSVEDPRPAGLSRDLSGHHSLFSVHGRMVH